MLSGALVSVSKFTCVDELLILFLSAAVISIIAFPPHRRKYILNAAVIDEKLMKM